MQQTLRFAGIAVLGIIASMLWFWLLFGGPRFLCAGSGQSLFIIGAGQFAALALLWGLGLAALLTFRARLTLLLPFWAFLAGSLFFTIHRAIHTWRAGVDLSLSALAAIAISQSLALGYLRALRLDHRQFGRALMGCGIVGGAGLLGVLVTTLWRATIPCSASAPAQSAIVQFITGPIGWYLLCGVFPAGLTALLYASETQPPR